MNRLIKISNGKIEAGVVPDLGGVVAQLNLAGKPNILKFDKTILDKPPPARRAFGPNPVWKAYNGHIVWLGPQSEWWVHQDKSPKKREERAVWPPDPYINNGYYEVTECGTTHVVMVGPASEFSGVQLTKFVSIEGGKVQFKVRARNIRDVPVSWDLWFNTRVDGYARCYAPVRGLDYVRIDGRVTDTEEKSVFTHDRGFCGVTSQAPSRGKEARWAKAFIPAEKGFMAAFVPSQALVIRFKKHQTTYIHPEHALVEFYNYTGRGKKDALTELEYHSPYVTLMPGETMEAAQTWEVHPFIDKPEHKDCLKFLGKM